MTRTMRLALFGLWFLVLPFQESQAQAPSLAQLFPAGGQQGQTVEVQAIGAFESWPVQTWLDRPGVTFESGEEPGTLSARIDEAAEPGLYWLRLYNDEGASALRPFLVGTLPEVVEIEPNDAPDEAQRLEGSSVVVNGRLAQVGDVDGFAVELEAGQTLVAALDAHRPFGSPMDGILQVVTPDGFVLAHEDDSPGLDPLLVFEALEEGTYIVRLFAFPETPTSAIRFDGGESHIYRLTLTTGGFANHAMPPLVFRDEPGSVSFQGWNIPEEARQTSVSIVEGADGRVWASHPQLGNAVPILLQSHPVTMVENLDAPLTPPLTVCGTIESSRDVKTFFILAEKDRSYSIDVSARGLGSFLDPMVQISDESGEILEEQDDPDRNVLDPALTFKAPESGVYSVSVRDLHGRGGDRFFFAATVTEAQPDYRLNLSNDRFALSADELLEIPVAIDRTQGFSEPIEITVEDLPEGVEIEPATSEPEGDSSENVTLVLKGGTEPFSGPIRVVGTTSDDAKPRLARASLSDLDARTSHIWLTVQAPASDEDEDDSN